jgi:hypothetical protein
VGLAGAGEVAVSFLTCTFFCITGVFDVFPVVNVPVLSQQISPIQPNATIALCRAMFVMPFAIVIVTTALKDSGMMASAKEIAYNATPVEILNRAIAKTIITKIIDEINRKCANVASLQSAEFCEKTSLFL